MAKKKKETMMSDDWSKVIRNMKTKVYRIYHIDDVERVTPYIFNGWSKDYVTGEKLITMYTKREDDEDLDYGHYKTLTLNMEVFKKNFIEVEEEI